MPDLFLDALTALLGDRYTLERELGGGGMSRVFVATEAALKREVVVKVLPPELVSAESLRRFEREIEMTVALQHPHILPVLTAGDSLKAGNGGRRTDYCTVTTSEQTVLNVEVAGAIKGPFGLVSQGLVAHSSAQIGSTLSTLVPAGTWRLFVTGADSTTTGSYTITTSTSSLAARSGCENLAVVSGQTIAGKVDSSDCSATVPDWSPYTAFRGKTFYLDLYRAKLLAGKTYTFSTAHSGTGVNACSVLWVGGKIVASVLDKGPETNPKVMTYTSAVDQYATVEVEGCSTRGDVWSPGAVTNYALTISP